MASIILSTASYVLLWLKEKRNYLIYVLACSFVYLTALTFVRTLDILLPVYFLALFLPVALSIRRISKFTFLIAVYEIGYLLYGMIFQDSVASIVAFVSRNWQFLVFFLVYDVLQRKPESYFEPWLISKKVLTFSIIIESLLGFYLAFFNLSRGRDLRLVADAHPITGNIAIIMLPLIAGLFYGEVQSREERIDNHYGSYLKYALILFLWTILSGTRGYVLVYGVTLISIFYTYFFESEALTSNKKGNRILMFAVISTVLIGVVIFAPSIVERAMSFLRIGSGASTGIRRFENAAVIGFWKDTSLRIKLFGIGIGGKPGNYSEFLTNLQSQFALGMWDRVHYLNDSGAIFHNLYACILCSQGVLGIVFVSLCYIGILKRITVCSAHSKSLRRTLHMYVIGFAVMNYYRWAATCGICELIVLACVLSLSRERNK